MRKSMRRIGYALAMVALLPMLGCFGSFTLTRKVYQFNEEVSQDKWVKEGVFLLLAIFPYGLATSADAIFFNAVEFWTGEKLIADAPRDNREFREEYKQPAPAPALTPAPKTAPKAPASAPAKKKSAPKK